jgi:hypothetical protein
MIINREAPARRSDVAHGTSTPFDPFQLSRSPARDQIQDLSRRWIEITTVLDDASLELAGDEDEDARRDELWDEMTEVEERLLALPVSTVGHIAAKLRIMSWHMNAANSHCDNHDGVRTNELEPDEVLIIALIADAERLAGGVS